MDWFTLFLFGGLILSIPVLTAICMTKEEWKEWNKFFGHK